MTRPKLTRFQRYQRSTKGRTVTARYVASDKGKASQAARSARYYAAHKAEITARRKLALGVLVGKLNHDGSHITSIERAIADTQPRTEPIEPHPTATPKTHKNIDRSSLWF